MKNTVVDGSRSNQIKEGATDGNGYQKRGKQETSPINYRDALLKAVVQVQPGLARSEHTVCSSYETFGFRRLKPQTNLKANPPNWVERDAFRTNLIQQPGWTKLWRGKSSQDPTNNTISLIEHAFMERKNKDGVDDPPDFIGSAKSLRRLFSIPFTDKEVSMVIHRVGRTMLINSLASAEQPQVGDDPCLQGKGFYSVEGNSVPKAIEIENLNTSQRCSKSERDDASKDVPNRGRSESERNEMERRFIFYSAKSTSSKATQFSGAKSFEQKNEGKNPKEEKEWKGSFRRTILWQFKNMQLLSGSNLIVCRDKSVHESEFSVRLHDVNKGFPKSRCIDYYLENRLAGVDALALCLHNDGFVRDYRMCSTEDILLLGDEGMGSSFAKERKRQQNRTINEIENRSSALLEFLRTRCNPESSYWLHKEPGQTNIIRLCELTSSMTQTPKGRERWMYNMAMLCYRVAQKYSPAMKQKRSPSKDSSCSDHPTYNIRHRELLLKSLELLDEIANKYEGPPRNILRASLHEQVANNYLLSVDPAVRMYNTDPSNVYQGKRKEALRFLKYAVAHWENVRFFLQEDCRLRKRKENDICQDELGPDMDKVNKEAMARSEEQLIICYTQMSLQHQVLGNLKEALKVITEGISRSLKAPHLPRTLQEAVTVCGDVLIELGFKISHGKCYMESDTKDLIQSLDELKRKFSPLLAVPLIVLDNGIQTSNLDLGLVEQLYVSALQCYDLAKKQNRNSSITRGLNFKTANGWNELGKFYIIIAQKYCSPENLWPVFEIAQTCVMKSVELFQKSNDVGNAVACLCNINHLYRYVAVSTAVRQNGVNHELFTKAIEVLQNAKLYCKSVPKKSHMAKDATVWTSRIDMEIGMTHLAYGNQLKSFCRKLVENGDTTLCVDVNQRAEKELYSAIRIYERYINKIPQARKQMAAVHYHLGSQYIWLYSRPQGVRDSMMHDANDTVPVYKSSLKKAYSLADRHFRLALENFAPGSPEYEVCIKEYELLVPKRPKGGKK